MERLACRALVLGGVDYGDSDRIVTLFTDTQGRLAAFARAARKSRRRFAGVLEPFTLLAVQLVETRGDTCRLDAAEVLDAFGELRSDIGRVSRAAYAAELAKELAREREPHAELFDLLQRLFHCLAREGAGPEELMRFELAALAVGGLMPRLDACARCGEEAPQEPVFDPQHGGILCARCGRGLALRVSREASRALVQLQRPRVAGSAALSSHVRAEVRGLLSQFISHHLGKRLKSLEFMRQLGVEA